jgi:glycosyltransferase involved in cell wall biosynthesis
MLPVTSNSQGSSSALLRKAALRLLRDARVWLRSARISLLVLIVFCFLAPSLFALWHLLTRSGAEDVFPNALAHAPQSGYCACNDALEWHRMKHVLATSDFVARAFVHTGSNRSWCPQLEPGFTCLRVDTVFRGSPRHALYPVVVSNSDVHACSDAMPGFPRNIGLKAEYLGAGVADESSDYISGRDNTFLLVGGIGNLESSQALKATILRPDRTCAVVWVVRWASLADDVREAIVSESSHSDGWWRHKQTWRDPSLEWWSDSTDGGSVSIVAACKNRHETLRQAAETWRLVRGVSEIVLLDFGSSPAIQSVLSQSLREDSRFVLASAPRQTQWALGRAYNAAIQLASSAVILKVDCDVMLDADFLEAHPLHKGEMYAGDWRALRSNVETEKLHVNGLLMAYRDEVIRAGGYDERVMTYGWDDSDIVTRLGRAASPRQFDYSKVRHLPHSTSMRIENQRHISLLPPENFLAPFVETQRNRLLLTRCGLHSWQEDSTRVHWNAAVRFVGEGGPSGVLFLFQANTIASSIDLVSQEEDVEMSKRAIRLVLVRYGVSLLPKTLSLAFYLGLAARVGFPERYVHINLRLHGGCVSRLISIAASRAVSGSAELGTLSDASGLARTVTMEAATVSPPHKALVAAARRQLFLPLF